MIEPCSRCGDPNNDHETNESPSATERNCNLYRIGTQLERLNGLLERIASAAEGAALDWLERR
jgi:hypothetical protein